MNLGLFDVLADWELRDHISDFMHQIANNGLIHKFSFPVNDRYFRVKSLNWIFFQFLLLVPL